MKTSFPNLVSVLLFVYVVGLASSPNIAIMFYKTRTLLTLLPISNIQGTLSQLRNLIDSMMLLSTGIRYFFIKDNIIVANEEVPLHSKLFNK